MDCGLEWIRRPVMRFRKTAAVAMLGAGSLVMVPIVAQTTGPLASNTQVINAPSTQPTDRESMRLQSIRSAPDPSSAVNAFADAKAAEPGNVAFEKAYVAKMVEFQLPEMAEAQARDVSTRDPADSLSWAVLAYMHAKEDHTTQALTEISVAA